MANQIILKYNPDGSQPFYMVKPISSPFDAHMSATPWINQNIVTNPDDTWEIVSTRINTSITKTLLNIVEQIHATCCRKVTNLYGEIYYVFPPVPNLPMCDHPDTRVVDAWCDENLIDVTNCEYVYIRKDTKWQPE